MSMVSRLPVTLLATLLLFSGCTQLRLDMRRPMPVQVGGMELIAVSGNAYQRGLQIGQAYAEELRRIIPTALLIDDQLDAEEMAAGAPSREDTLLLAAAQWPAEQRQEMAGIADGSGLKEADVLRYNTLAAIRQAWQTREASPPALASQAGQSADFTIAPMPALESVWHPILLYRIETAPGSLPASAPAVVGRPIEARQVGMVWPLWMMNRYGVLVIGNTTDQIEKGGAEPALWGGQRLAHLAPSAADGHQLLLNLTEKDDQVISLPTRFKIVQNRNAHLEFGAMTSRGLSGGGESVLLLLPVQHSISVTLIANQPDKNDHLKVQAFPTKLTSIINLSPTRPLIENGSDSSSASKQP